MGAKFVVSVVIQGVDRATTPIAKIQAAINRAKKPLTDVMSSVKKLGDAGGLPKLVHAGKEVGHAIGEFATKLKEVGWELVKVGTEVTVVTYEIARQTTEWGEATYMASIKVGVSAETLQEWRLAAKMAHVDGATLEKGMSRLNRVVGAAIAGNRQAREAIALLGTSAFDAAGKVKPLDKLLPVIADKIRETTDPFKRAYIAQEIFGKGGQELIPMLAGGAEQLAKVAEEGRRLGLIFSNETVKGLAESNDSLDLFEGVIKSVAITIGSVLAPEVVRIAQEIEEWIAKNRPMIADLAKQFADSLPAAVELAVDAFHLLIKILSPLIAGFQWLSKTIGPAPALLLVIGTVILATLIPATVGLVAAIMALSAALVGTPFGWVVLVITIVIAAIIGLGVAIYALWKNWDKVGGWIADKWGWLVQTVRNAIEGWKLGLQLAWTFVSTWAKKIGGYIVDKIIAAWTGLKDFFGGLWDWITDKFTSAYQWIVDKLISLTDLLPDWLKEKLGLTVNLAGSSSAPDAAPAIGTVRQAAIAGSGSRSSGNAAIQVDFKNMPKGVSVKPVESKDVDLDLTLGYSMGGA